jgi:opacity protein-like surface antigen
LVVLWLVQPALAAPRVFCGLESGYTAVLSDWYSLYKPGFMISTKLGLQADRYTLTELSLYFSPHDGRTNGTRVNIIDLGLGARFRVAPLNPLNPYVYIGAAASYADEILPFHPPNSSEWSKSKEWTTDWMVGIGGEVNLFRKTTINYGPVFHFTRIYFPDDSPDGNSDGYMAVDVKAGINYYF